MHVMDVDGAIAAKVASVVDCPSTTDVARLLGDPNVQVVVVASPAEVHAEQVVAACRSGKRAVLCEKPLATTREDARRILEASESTGTAVVVGTMHAYDPACMAAMAAWKSLGDEVVLVRSRINLPSDEVYVAAASQVLSQPPPWTAPTQPWARGLAEEFISGMMLGLTIHDIPLVRELLPTVDHVTFATTPGPIGYAITARCGTGLAQFSSLVTGKWDADWRLEAWSGATELGIDFPPSYVNAGSARARLTTDGGDPRVALPNQRLSSGVGAPGRRCPK